MNLSIYGATSTPRAMAVPASPMSPPFLTCNGFEGLLNISTSWSMICIMRRWSPWLWHSLICLDRPQLEARETLFCCLLFEVERRRLALLIHLVDELSRDGRI